LRRPILLPLAHVVAHPSSISIISFGLNSATLDINIEQWNDLPPQPKLQGNLFSWKLTGKVVQPMIFIPTSQLDGKHFTNARNFNSQLPNYCSEKDCDVRIKVPSISRKHATIRIDENGQVLYQTFKLLH
jgi:hypothetical protein